MVTNSHESPGGPLQRRLDRLGERLARHRLNRNLTQAELARAAGISTRTLARLEGGESTQLENFLRILTALGLGDGLDRLVPDVPESPIQQLERSGRTRKRATGRRTGGPISRRDKAATNDASGAEEASEHADDTGASWNWAD